MKPDHYTYRVTWSPEDGEHVGLCAEFPSLSWLANTPEAALVGIRALVAEVVADMAEAGPGHGGTGEREACQARAGGQSRPLPNFAKAT
jgi:predicted RNase H-like HicB family nuclease